MLWGVVSALSVKDTEKIFGLPNAFLEDSPGMPSGVDLFAAGSGAGAAFFSAFWNHERAAKTKSEKPTTFVLPSVRIWAIDIH